VHALAGQRVQIDGQGGDQRLALTGGHLRDAALVQHDAADELHIIRNDLPRQRDAADVPGPSAQALARQLDGGERLREQVVERVLAGRQPGPEFGRLGAEVVVGQGFPLAEPLMDLGDEGLDTAHLALVLGTEDGFEEVFQHEARIGPERRFRKTGGREDLAQRS
jgi:hypothetical protein